MSVLLMALEMKNPSSLYTNLFLKIVSMYLLPCVIAELWVQASFKKPAVHCFSTRRYLSLQMIYISGSPHQIEILFLLRDQHYGLAQYGAINIQFASLFGMTLLYCTI